MADNDRILVHPYYNHGYARYDLDIKDVISGLRKAGYSLDDTDNGDGNGDEDLDIDLDPSYTMQMLSTNGTRCYNTSFSTVLYIRLYKNGIDITDNTPATNFKWRRISGNSEVDKLEDAEWNLRFASGAKECPITKQDLKRGTTFMCQYIEYSDQDVAYVNAAYKAYMRNVNNNNGGDN